MVISHEDYDLVRSKLRSKDCRLSKKQNIIVNKLLIGVTKLENILGDRILHNSTKSGKVVGRLVTLKLSM